MPRYVPQDREVGSFDTVDPGWYWATVDKVTPKYGPKAGYLLWQYSIFSPPEYEGKTFFHNTSVDAAAVSYPDTGLWAVLAALGVDSELEDEDLEFEEFSQKVDELAAGKCIQAQLGIREWEGNERNELLCLLAIPDSAPAHKEGIAQPVLANMTTDTTPATPEPEGESEGEPPAEDEADRQAEAAKEEKAQETPRQPSGRARPPTRGRTPTTGQAKAAPSEAAHPPF